MWTYRFLEHQELLTRRRSTEEFPPRALARRLNDDEEGKLARWHEQRKACMVTVHVHEEDEEEEDDQELLQPGLETVAGLRLRFLGEGALASAASFATEGTFSRYLSKCSPATCNRFCSSFAPSA